jgi:hypothetical protein
MYRILSVLVGGPVTGLGVGLGVELGVRPLVGLAGSPGDLLNLVLFLALIGGVLVELGGRLSGIIMPTDRVQWSWQIVRLEWWLWLGGGLVFGLFAVLSAGLIDVLSVGLIDVLSAGLGTQLNSALTMGLGSGLLIGLLRGFQPGHLDRRSRPIEGIRRSVLSGLFALLSVGLSVGLTSGLSIGLSGGVTSMLSIGLIIGLVFGSLGGLVGGWAAVIQHYTLRLILWRSGVFPRDITAFCDSCAERILLRRVGGGWIFVHRLLLEYFAELDEDKTTPVE